MDHRKTKSKWMSKPDERINNKPVSAYPVKNPWDQRENDVLDEFERTLNAADYEYHSLFEVPEMSAAKQKQIDEYSMNPPFRTSYNIVKEDLKPARRPIAGKNPPTRQPWAHGSLPADPVPKKIYERPPTALWAAPPETKKQTIMESSGDPILDSLRLQLKSHGASGIAGLARKFKIMDDDGSGTLNEEEFRKGMRECKVCDLSDKAIAHLFRYFDRDDSGSISYDEFLVGIRGVLNSRRRGLVHLAFKIMDKDGSGFLDIDDIRGVYSAKSHPDVVQGRKTEDEVLSEFLQSFEVGKQKDCIITLDEFESYYANVSASIDSDDYFELMMRNAWHISGGEGQYANTSNRRVLVTHADGTQTVEEVQNDIGIQANDKEAMIAKLKAQGIHVGTINTTGSAGMNNQHEAKDFYKTRVNPGQTEQPQYLQQPGSGRGHGGGGNAPHRLAEYAGSSSTGGGGHAGGSCSQQQPQPLYQQARGGGVYANDGGNNASGGPVKPVRLSDLLATTGGSVQQQQQRRPGSAGYRR